MNRITSCTVLLMALVAPAAQAQTKLIVGVAPAGEFIATMVAKEQGFFKKRGLDVEVQIMPPGATVPGLQSGSLQIGAVGTPTLLQTSDSGLDFMLVAGGAIASKTDTNFGLLVKTGVAIDKPQDFVGKKIGTPGLESFFHVLAREWFTINKVDYKKVTFVEVPFPQLSDVMKAGTVDAVLTTEPFKTRTIEAGVGTKFFAIAADLPDGLPPFVYAARRDWTVANADAVKAFREALAEGIRFADANPDAARADYGKFVKLPPDALAKVRWNKMNASVTPQQLALWEDMMRRQGMLKNPTDVAKLIAP
jgi:NitT/TauT family transport system substrate-binding protein